jgi:site-specific DNA recombinase
MLEQAKTTLEAKVINRAVLYARVSSDDTRKDGRNLAGQLEMGREYAESKGYRIVAEMPEDDRGASGAEIDLPQLNRIRDMAARQEFDVLIVRELDRLSRNLAKQLIIEEELKGAGVRIEYVLGEYEDSPEGRLNKHIRATIAEYEREKIRERITRGLRNKVKAGSVMVHGNPPYAYRDVAVNGVWRLEIYEPEAEIIRLIFRWYVFGDESRKPLALRAIARKLNDMGIPSSKGGVWHLTVVRSMLSSETYAGVWRYGKNDNRDRLSDQTQTITVEVDPVVGRDLWEAAQERIEYNKRHGKRNRKPGRYLLSCRVDCGDCNHKLSGTSKIFKGKRYGYYIHSPGTLNINHTEADSHKGYNAENVDDRVWQWIEEESTDKEKLLRGAREYRTKQQKALEPVKKELALTEQLIEDKTRQLDVEIETMRLLTSPRAKAKKAADIAAIENQIDSLENRKAELAARLDVEIMTDEQAISMAELTGQVVADLKTLKEVQADNPELALMVFEAKQQLIDMLNLKVTLFRENGNPQARITAKVAPSGVTLPVEYTSSWTTEHNRQAIILTVTLEL